MKANMYRPTFGRFWDFGQKHAIDNLEWCWKLRRVLYAVPTFHELWSTNAVKWDRHTYPPCVDVVCCFFTSRGKGRSPNRTQPHFATSWKVNQICKRMSRNWRGFPFRTPPPKYWGAKTAYFVTVFNSTKICQMSKNMIGVFTLLP